MIGTMIINHLLSWIENCIYDLLACVLRKNNTCEVFSSFYCGVKTVTL